MFAMPCLMIAHPYLQAREVTLCPGYVIMQGRNEVTASIKPDELFNFKSFEVSDTFKVSVSVERFLYFGCSFNDCPQVAENGSVHSCANNVVW